jgi:hypothetical protein
VPVTVRYPGGSSGQLGEIVTTHYYWQTAEPKSLVGSSAYVSNATYREFGAPSQINMGTNIVNTYSYDTAMRLNEHSLYGILVNNRFWMGLNYDQAGNIVRSWTGPHQVVAPGSGSTLNMIHSTG